MSDANGGAGSGPTGGEAGPGPDSPVEPNPYAGWGPPAPPPGGWQPPGPPGGWQPPGPPMPAPKPGVIPLRPLDMGEILDGAFTAVRRYPALMLGSSVIVVGISQALNFVVERNLLRNVSGLTRSRYGTRPDPTAILNVLGAGLANLVITIVITSLAQVLLTGFLTVVVGQAVLGRPVSFGEAWSRLRSRLLPLLGLTFLYGVLVFLGSLLLIVPGIWLWVLYGLAVPVLVLEPASIRAALRRSRELVRGLWWRIFGIVLLSSLIAGIVALIIGLPFSLAGNVMNASAGGLPTTTSLLLSSIGATIGGTITYPFVASVRVLLYFDQRMRREGLDIELARQAGVPMPGPWQPPTRW